MIKGYDQLTEADKNLYNKFLNNFLMGWEYPEEWKPKSVRVEEDEANGRYLRVTFKHKQNGKSRNAWFHVVDLKTWY